MAGPLGISLGALFFLLIPGLAGLKTFLRTYVRLDDLTKVDKLALAGVLGGGTLGIMLLFLNWGCWSSRLPELLGSLPTVDLTKWGTDGYWCGEQTTVKIQTIQSLPIVILMGMIGTQSIISAVGGGLAGWYLNRIEDGPSREPKYIEQPWEYISENTFREVTEATVITAQGDEIEGEVYRLGTPSEDYDILLKSPIKVLRDSDDNIIKHRELGDYSYHHYRDISQVRMENLEDYDAETPDQDTTTQSDTDQEQTGQTDNGEGEGGLDFETELNSE